MATPLEIVPFILKLSLATLPRQPFGWKRIVWDFSLKLLPIRNSKSNVVPLKMKRLSVMMLPMVF